MRSLFHFSEDPTIRVFTPDPSVWAIDEEHAPSYWFPRDCPRACCWKAGDKPLTSAGTALLGLGGANRLHAIESAWLQRTRDCRLYVYEFDSTPFRMKVADAGYWVTDQEVTPRSVSPVGDLLKRHIEAEIELRIVKNLWNLIDAIVLSGLEFSSSARRMLNRVHRTRS